MREFFRAIGIVVGLLSFTALGMLLLAGIALSCAKRNEDGDL